MSPTHMLEHWESRLADLESFVAEHGRAPKKTGGTAEETSLNHWCQYSCSRHTPDADRRRAAVEAIIGPRRRYNKDAKYFPGRELSQDELERRVQELKTYRDATGWWPTKRNPNKRLRSLGSWLETQRIRAESIPAIGEHLDRHLPGWRESYADAFSRKAQEVAVFRDTLGFLPRRDRFEEPERRLGKWLADQRHGRGLTAERENILDETVPGWRQTNQHGTRPKRTIWDS